MQNEAVNMALGRIFGMMQRPYRPGDIEEYERCRALVLDNVEIAGPAAIPGYAVSWVRDRAKGAAGD